MLGGLEVTSGGEAGRGEEGRGVAMTVWISYVSRN